MQVFKNSAVLPDNCEGAVVVIGNFDGVHKGHQALLAQAKEFALSKNLPLGVLTFAPHPRLFFTPDTPPFLLTNNDQKTELLSKYGANFVVFEHFDAKLSKKSPQYFVDMIKNKYNPSMCMVGQNFHFGYKKQGHSDDLVEMGQKAGFDVQIVELTADQDTTRYSSTRLREAIQEADLATARDMLGHDWSVEAVVIKGDQRGRELGYPTANQKLGHYIEPKYGVYAVRVQIKGMDSWLNGVANFGVRPMFKIETPLLETYIFDFDQDIYGEVLCVKPVQYLRGEMNFDSLDDLIAQIDQDALNARRILEKSQEKAKAHGM